MPELFFSDGIKTIIGSRGAVIYDFLEGRAYRINKGIAKVLQDSVPGSIKKVRTALLQATGSKGRSAASTTEAFLSALKERGILNRSLNEAEIEKKIINGENLVMKHCAIETTINCNFSCAHCYIGERQLSANLSLHTLRSIFDQLT